MRQLFSRQVSTGDGGDAAVNADVTVVDTTSHSISGDGERVHPLEQLRRLAEKGEHSAHHNSSRWECSSVHTGMMRESKDLLDSCFADGMGTSTNDGEKLDEEEYGWRAGDPLHMNKYDRFRIARLRDRVGAILNCKISQIVVSVFIVANALILGAMTFLFDNPSAYGKLEVLDLAFLCCFTLEIFLQFFYLGRKLLSCPWEMFDSIVIILSWAFSGTGASVLRSFRIFRVLSLLSKWSSLRHLVKAIGRTLPNMATIGVALMLFLYTFCVLYTNLYHDLYPQGYLDYPYFGRLDKTFLTLFQFMTLDSWTGVVRQVEEARPASWIGFIAFVIITAFFALNLVVAVICESIIELKSLKETRRQNQMLRTQRNLIEDQTHQLVRESSSILSLQRQMIRNQIALHRLMLDTANHLGVEIHDLDFDNDSDDAGSCRKTLGKNKLMQLISSLSDEDEDATIFARVGSQNARIEAADDESLPSESFRQPSLSPMQSEKRRKQNRGSSVNKREKRRSGGSTRRRHSSVSLSEIQATAAIGQVDPSRKHLRSFSLSSDISFNQKTASTNEEINQKKNNF